MQNSYSLATHSFALVGNYFRVTPGTDNVNPDNYNLATNRYRLWFSGNSLVISDNLSTPLYYEHGFYRPAIDFTISSSPSNLGVVTGTIVVAGNAVPVPTNFIFLHDNLQIEISLNPANTTVFRVVTSEPVLIEQFPAPTGDGGHGDHGHGDHGNHGHGDHGHHGGHKKDSDH